MVSSRAVLAALAATASVSADKPVTPLKNGRMYDRDDVLGFFEPGVTCAKAATEPVSTGENPVTRCAGPSNVYYAYACPVSCAANFNSIFGTGAYFQGTYLADQDNVYTAWYYPNFLKGDGPDDPSATCKNTAHCHDDPFVRVLCPESCAGYTDNHAVAREMLEEDCMMAALKNPGCPVSATALWADTSGISLLAYACPLSCGDHLATPSLNGALRSGRVAAEALLDDLGLDGR